MREFWKEAVARSEETFIRDQVRMSGPSSGWMVQKDKGGNEGLPETLVPPARQKKYLSELYHYINEVMIRNLTISCSGGEIEKVELIFYHERFGWVGHVGLSEVFLGKTVLDDSLELCVGERTYLSGPSRLRGSDLISIGKFCSIAEGLYAGASPDFHPMKVASTYAFSHEPRDPENVWNMGLSYREIEVAPCGIEIGSAVWLGRDVRIYHGARVGNGCVVAEGSFIKGELVPYGIYAGRPAKLRRLRFNESLIEALEVISWWDWPAEKIRRNKRFFATDLSAYQGQLKELIED